VAKVKLSGYRCERCGHEWLPRETGQEPRVCPRCKSPYWNRPRKNSKALVKWRHPGWTRAMRGYEWEQASAKEVVFYLIQYSEVASLISV